jgi:hypothetical protein
MAALTVMRSASSSAAARFTRNGFGGAAGTAVRIFTPCLRIVQALISSGK